jgi:hypothetical protein
MGGHVTRIGKTRNVYRILVEKYLISGHFKDGEINLKMLLGKWFRMIH